MPNKPEIDGLRGIAILAVLLNHVDRSLLPGGYVGVDVFFVISGYLITGILRRDISAQDFSFSHFYSRRVKRLLPAGGVMAALTAVGAAFLLLPKEFKEFGTSMAAYALMATNFLFWKWDDYFAGQHASWPLLHTWSLAVEEQFYLLFPWLIWNLRQRSQLCQVTVMVALSGLSFAFSTWQTQVDPRSAYYLLPSRAWEMLAGALVAYLPAMTSSFVQKRIVGTLAIIAIVLPMHLYSEQTPFPGIAAVPPVLGTAMILYLIDSEAYLLKRLLSSSALVLTGKMSYSLYLWHWPVLVLLRYPWSGMPETLPPLLVPTAVIISFVIAWLSYRYIESPCRRVALPDQYVLALALLSIIGFTFAGLAIRQAQGYPSRLPRSSVRFAAGATDFHPRASETFHLSLAEVCCGRLPLIGEVPPTRGVTFVVWGDSHANALVPAFDEAAKRRKVSGYALTRGATPPVSFISFAPGGPYPIDEAFRSAAFDRIKFEDVPHVILVARWTTILQRDFLQNGVPVRVPAEKEAMLAEALIATAAALGESGVRKTWIVEEVPTQRFHVPKQLALQALYGWQDTKSVTLEDHDRETAGVRRVFDVVKRQGIGIVNLNDVFFQGVESTVADHGLPLYIDHTHLSVTGARRLTTALTPLFDQLDIPSK
jgi:peptidoglycan/LPS O-acetylase OafA/YrhL